MASEARCSGTPWPRRRGRRAATPVDDDVALSHLDRRADFNDVLPSIGAHAGRDVTASRAAPRWRSRPITFVGKFSNMHQGFEVLHESVRSTAADRCVSKTARPHRRTGCSPWLGEHRDVPFYVAAARGRTRTAPSSRSRRTTRIFADPAGTRGALERQMQKVQPLIRNANMRPRIMPTRDELVEAGIDPAAFIAYEKRLVRRLHPRHGRRDRARGGAPARAWPRPANADRLHERPRRGVPRALAGRSTGRAPTASWPTCPVLLVAGAVVPAGSGSPEMTQSIDIMPTLLELSGMPAPAGISGASLVPFLRGERNPAWPRPAITEAAGRMVANGEEDGSTRFGIALDGWKLVHHPKRRAGRPSTRAVRPAAGSAGPEGPGGAASRHRGRGSRKSCRPGGRRRSRCASSPTRSSRAPSARTSWSGCGRSGTSSDPADPDAIRTSYGHGILARMSVIESHVDVSLPEFQENLAHMRSLEDDLASAAGDGAGGRRRGAR